MSWRRAVLGLLRAGRGRLLPLLILLAACAALHFGSTNPLGSLQLAQFDRYQRWLPRERSDEPVIVVAIDSPSLVQYGQWPWPRDLVAQLLDRIGAGKPLAIGLDIVFAETDRLSPEMLAKRLSTEDADLISRLPDPDAALAAAIARHPVTLAVIGLGRELPGSRLPAKPLPALNVTDDQAPLLPHFASALASLPRLQRDAGSEGFINATPHLDEAYGERGIVRQLPTVALIADQPALSLPLAMVRQALGDLPATLSDTRRGMHQLSIGDYRLPVAASGEVFLHFGKANGHYYVSAADVLAGVYPPSTFANRFVIVGFDSTGLRDRIITPLGDSLPGLDVHVQVLESLLASHALHRPNWLPWLEQGALLLSGLLLIAGVPRLRPRHALLAFTAHALLLASSGYLAFAAGFWLFDGTTPVLLLLPVFIALLGNRLIAADRQRRLAEQRLQASREAAARISGELDAARTIQMGLLPDLARLSAADARFETAAILEPARAVGGDYYDAFLLDANRLCLAIGDVSGKGVPASLFMAISKTLTGTLARRHAALADAMCDLEIELSRHNPADLFVTAFIAVIDLTSGEMHYVCAGHDAPLRYRAHTVDRVATAEIGGPPLCAQGDYPYLAGQMQLLPGELLCLFTDGVSEADNGHELFGVPRLVAALQTAGESPLPALADALRDTVRGFENGAPPADDLTLLLFRWQGPAV